MTDRIVERKLGAIGRDLVVSFEWAIVWLDACA